MINTQNYFQILLNDNTNPCMVVEVGTLEVVFINYSMKKMLKESKDYNNGIIEDTKCYQLLHNTYKKCHHCNLEKLQTGFFSELNVYNEHLNRSYRISNTIIELNGKKYNLNKFFLPSSYTKEQVDFSSAISISEDILKKDDLGEITYDFLALLGEFYSAKKSYIFNIDKVNNKILNHYNWLENESLEVPVEISNTISVEEFKSLLSQTDKFGVREFSNFDENTNEKDLKLLKSFDADCITLCPLIDENNEITGAVGVTNRSKIGFDYRLLKSVTNFINDKFKNSNLQEELDKISNIDYLTGFFTQTKYAKVVAEYEKNPPQNMGVVFFNINGLRKTNEYMGHIEGDKVLVNCASLLKNYFSEPIFRISGDEFVCFCVGDSQNDFTTKVNVLRHDLLSNNEFPFSIGNAWRKSHYNIQKLIVEADIVMYINKQKYYNDKSSSIDGITQNSTLKELLQHLTDEEFVVYLQPQVDLQTGEVIAAEALVRRYDKKNKVMIYPDDFIPLYEQKSIIRHVDIFVVDKVCQLLSAWHNMGKDIHIAVNLSRVTLMEFGIVDTIVKICDKYDLPHNLLIIEVTERVGLIESDVANSLVDEFKTNGFEISLDDFGCGYSNIVTLAKISVDEVKIDKSLVDDLTTNYENQVIVSSVIHMCSRLNKTHTLAEGIETVEQESLLREFNCNMGQGYLYSKPIPCDEFFEKYIK